ncbi:MAG TPA: bifunctional phosphoribosylaminoimidazolecarboxamide formyltransferase/IMP cyclohydrolase [Deltaproteobacteria bacterium]|nr:bifunctional phosphoribosylaminoimidazolecarboxamide formyltransferase/IMP cyclohydrolase [Deltaproteobacteria bacterium]
MKKVRRAIVSVTDKSGIEDFVKRLEAAGVEIISTGGTAELLKKAGVDVIPISAYTGFPEMLDGRVKTLHPKIHGGILAMRDNPEHRRQMESHDILPIDMIVVNLYAFEETVAGGCTLEEAIENIDIGGPTMIRAAAKNFRDVAVVTDPADYDAVMEEMERNGGALSEATRFELAKKVFSLTARYDGAVSNYLTGLDGPAAFPSTLTMQFAKVQDLRYGENPHQAAAFYREGRGGGLADAVQLHGKELSFNNILDLHSAMALASEFDAPAAAIIKHNNPCGAACSEAGPAEAYRKALECDRSSAFGGIVAFNRPVTADVARELSGIFLEAVIAPGFDDEALDILRKKKNIRLMAAGKGGRLPEPDGRLDIKRVSGGVLVQEPDRPEPPRLRTVTRREPTADELEGLAFAWRVAKHVKSNVIVLAKDGRTVGIGAGQMSRIDSTKIAVMKAGDAGLDVRGSVLASDAFFPFRDNVDLAAENGVTAIIQPGGSIRDDEVIAAADEHGMAMVFTGVRHFRH